MTDFVFEWDDSIPRNPHQLAHNRRVGAQHYPPDHPFRTIHDGPPVFVVEINGRVRRICADWPSAIRFLNDEEREWRFVEVAGSHWVGHRYCGGSGPTGEIRIYQMNLYEED